MIFRILRALPPAALMLAACSGGGDDAVTVELGQPLPANAQAYVLLETDGGSHYIQRIANSGGGSVAAVAQLIEGLPPGEELVGMDFRPQDGNLYLIGRNGGAASARGAIYMIDAPLPTAAPLSAVLVGELEADPGDTAGAAPFDGLEAVHYGADFDPHADSLRIVGDDGSNLRLPFASIGNPALVVTDAALSQTGISAAAYSNNAAGAASTQLFVIAPQDGQLYEQTPQDDGSLSPVAGLTQNGAALLAAPDLGFDMLTSGAANIAFLAGRAAGAPDHLTLGTVNMASGAVTQLQRRAGYQTLSIRGLAMAPAP